MFLIINIPRLFRLVTKIKLAKTFEAICFSIDFTSGFSYTRSVANT